MNSQHLNENTCSAIPSNSTAVLKAFIQRPLQTGAITASGTILSRTMAEMAKVNAASVVVELGSGSGVVTEEIVRQATTDCKVISLEIDAGLTIQTMQRCPTVSVFNSDARQLRSILDELELKECEAIVSCIPWANLNATSQSQVLDAISTVLKPGGSLTTFAYLHGMLLPNARRFLCELKERYGNVEKSSIIWSNLPPAVVYKVQSAIDAETVRSIQCVGESDACIDLVG